MTDGQGDCSGLAGLGAAPRPFGRFSETLVRGAER